jgi:hypothetical protein
VGEFAGWNFSSAFAAHAVIAIENVRLFGAEKQRTLALAHANRDLAEREAKTRRLVEAQAPQVEDELRAIIDNVPVFLWSDLPDGYCDFLNRPWLTYFNLSLQEAHCSIPTMPCTIWKVGKSRYRPLSRSRLKRGFEVPMVNIDGS